MLFRSGPTLLGYPPSATDTRSGAEKPLASLLRPKPRTYSAPISTTPPANAVSPAPASPNAPAPAPPATAAVTWPSTAMPWSPPTQPANLPAGYTVNDDLGAVDPMFIAMAQSALHIMKNALPANSSPSALAAYSDPVDGNVTAGFTEALIYVQTSLSSAFQAQSATLPPSSHAPRVDGTLDLKTLSALVATILSSSAVAFPISPTATSDPAIANFVADSLTAMVPWAASGAGGSFGGFTTGIVLPINLSSALPRFQANMNALRPSVLPTFGYQNTQVDWATGLLIIGLVG